jgi:hypothetical protein
VCAATTLFQLAMLQADDDRRRDGDESLESNPSLSANVL